ncbi:hypothetical protein D3C80_2113130 [compost metagenome]
MVWLISSSETESPTRTGMLSNAAPTVTRCSPSTWISLTTKLSAAKTGVLLNSSEARSNFIIVM